MPVAYCFICGESFGAQKSLNRHIKEVHNTENVLKGNCSQCDYVGKQRNCIKNGICWTKPDSLQSEMAVISCCIYLHGI